MLFTKRKQFRLLNEQIKEEIASPNGEVVLKINLRYPKIQCPKGDKMAVYAKPLYEKIALGLCQYAKTELYKKALETYSAQPQGFAPFSAVMSWENTYIDENYLSVLLDISIGNSNGIASTQKKTQVWDRKSGVMCTANDFLSADALKELKRDCAKKDEGVCFHKELFLLREGTIQFLLMKEGGYVPLSLPYEISQKGCFA